MAELDFTALNKLAYKGFETASESRSAASPSRQDKGLEPQKTPQRAPQSLSGQSRYKRAFRALFNYMEQAEIMLEEASGDTHKLFEAWDKIADIGEKLINGWDNGENEFILSMVLTINDELYRQYFEE